MSEILSNNWHIILSVILAGFSVIVLHITKEKKANDAAKRIEALTTELKKETQKLTDNITYGSLNIVIPFNPPINSSENWISKLTIPEGYEHPNFRKFLVEGHTLELKLYNETNVRNPITYNLVSKEFEYTFENVNNKNRNIVWNHDIHDLFELRLYYELSSQLDIDMKNFLEDASLDFILTSKLGIQTRNEMNSIADNLKPLRCSIFFNNVSQPLQFEFKKVHFIPGNDGFKDKIKYIFKIQK